MGNVLQKAVDAKADVDEKRAQYKADENKSEFMKLKAVMAETTGAPVLGPCICLAFHRFVALCAFAFFVYTILSAVPGFYEKKSFATVEFQTEFKLPDVYMCLPSTVVAKFTLKDKKHDKEWNGCQSRKVVCGNGWEDLEASTDPPPPDNYITGDLSGCPALIEMFGCEHPDYTEWAQANCQTTCSQKTNCKVVAEAQPIAGKDCQFRMLDESMVRGRYDIQGSNSGDGNNPLGGASLQIRSGFGEASESRAEVPLYAGRLVVQPRGVAFLGGVLLPGGPGMLVALLLFVLLLR